MEFEIFTTGTHTSDKGVTKTYSEDDLNFIADNYKPEEHEAPIVVGHPVDNSPAFGWIETLKVVGDKLIAKAKDIIPEFTEAVKQGLYKKRSISLDKDGKLRHVGFLGGAAPAVKGLADIQFSSEVSDTIELELSDNPEPGISHQESEIHYPEPSEKLFSSFSDQLNNIQVLLTNLYQNFSEKDSGQLKNITKQIDELKFKINTSEFEQKIDKKLSEGSFTPAMKQKTMNILEYINTNNFSEDSGKYKEDIKSLLNEFIDSVPRIIVYENFAEKPDGDNINYKEDYSGLPVDEESSAIHKKALSIMKKNNISYESAVLKLTRRTN